MGEMSPEPRSPPVVEIPQTQSVMSNPEVEEEEDD